MVSREHAAQNDCQWFVIVARSSHVDRIIWFEHWLNLTNKSVFVVDYEGR